MLSQLEIVKGGVAKRDLTPILTHLRIANNWVTATNGRLTITAPFPEGGELDIIVPAEKFITAVKKGGDIKLSITPTGKLSIKSKSFKALLPLLHDIEFPTPTPATNVIESRNLIEGLHRVKQFMGNDASRPWACGVLLYDGHAYATNNVILAMGPIEWGLTPVILPDFLIDELFRLKRDIISIRSAGNNITLQLEDDIWLGSTLIDGKWPKIMDILNAADYTHCIDIGGEVLQALENILPFCPDPKFPKINFIENAITTAEGDHQAEVEGISLPPSSWRAEPLMNLLSKPKGTALSADFSKYPKPCPWIRSDGLRGVIVGLRS